MFQLCFLAVVCLNGHVECKHVVGGKQSTRHPVAREEAEVGTEVRDSVAGVSLVLTQGGERKGDRTCRVSAAVPNSC